MKNGAALSRHSQSIMQCLIGWSGYLAETAHQALIGQELSMGDETGVASLTIKCLQNMESRL